MAIELWKGHPEKARKGEAFQILRNGEKIDVQSGQPILLNPGERIAIVTGVYHAFWPESDEAIIGEVSTANDDANDNFFVDPNIGRFPEIDEDEAPLVKLLWEQ